MRTLRRTCVVLFFLYLIVAPGGTFAASPRGVRQSSPQRIESPLTTLLLQAWETVARLWTKNGCGADSDGRCAPAPASTSNVDNGCGVDPNGHCGS